MDEIVVSQKVLSEAVQKIVGVCAEKTGKEGAAVLPHFFKIKFTGFGDLLRLAASGMGRNVQILISEVSKHKEASWGVAGAQLSALLRVLPKEDITIALSETGCAVFSVGESTFDLPSIGGDQFPEERVDTRREWINGDIDGILKTFSRLIFSTSDSDTGKPYNKAVCVTKDLIACTDSRRICYYPNNFLEVVEPILFPANRVRSYYNLFSGCASGSYSIDHSAIYFSSGGIYASCSCFAGGVPEFASALPSGPFCKGVFDRGRLMVSIRRCFAISEGSEAKKAPIAYFTFTSNRLEILFSSNGYKSKEFIAGEYEGLEIKIMLNLKYVLDALQSLSGAVAIFELRGDTRSVVVTGEELIRNVIQPFKR